MTLFGIIILEKKDPRAALVFGKKKRGKLDFSKMIVDTQLLSCSPPSKAVMAAAASGGISSSSSGIGSGDLDDLNRALYDLGAQDLLDVWEAMGSEVGINGFLTDLSKF